MPRRMKARRSRLRAPLGLALACSSAASGCGEQFALSRRDARARELPQALGLQAFARERHDPPALSGPGGATGQRARSSGRRSRYRETIESAGLTTVRRHRGGPGVLHRSGRRDARRLRAGPARAAHAILFLAAGLALCRPRAGRSSSLGPADDARPCAVDLTPEGGNPLRLTFARGDGRLARPPGAALRLSRSRRLHRWLDVVGSALRPTTIARRVDRPADGLGARGLGRRRPGGVRHAGRGSPRAAPRRARSCRRRDRAASGPRSPSTARRAARSRSLPGSRTASGSPFARGCLRPRASRRASPLTLAGASRGPSLWSRSPRTLPAGADARRRRRPFSRSRRRVRRARGGSGIYDPAVERAARGLLPGRIDDDGDRARRDPSATAEGPAAGRPAATRVTPLLFARAVERGAPRSPESGPAA